LALISAVLGAQVAGAIFPVWPFLIAALLLAGGNALLNRIGSRRRDRTGAPPLEQRHLVIRQALLDAIALWALTYFSGGVTSPLVFGFLLPVLMVSALLSVRAAGAFSGSVLAVLCLTALAESWGWLPHQAVFFHGVELVPSPPPMRTLAFLGVLGGATFATAALAGSFTRTHRRQVQDLDRFRETEALFSRRLRSVFSILETIGSVHDLHRVLETAVAEVAGVMQVKGASVKLLSDDGKWLRYEAAFGLPDTMIQERAVEVERSPLNKRIIEGEPFVTGQVTTREMFQFGETLSAARIQSVLFVPLHLEGRVIGILGAYCEKPDRFGAEEVNFFRLAAGLVAVAVVNERTIGKMAPEKMVAILKSLE
jgi:hypothetical protein